MIVRCRRSALAGVAFVAARHIPVLSLYPLVASHCTTELVCAAKHRRFSIGRHDWPQNWIRRKKVWDDMDHDTQLLWRVLGWTAATWDQCPQDQMKCWGDLSDEQRKAATELGYDNRLWDAEDKSRAKGETFAILTFVV
jgi:hypothetical protein